MVGTENGPSEDGCKLFGDCDGDNLVDHDDGRILADCVLGPAAGLGPDDPCRCDDLNGDGLVDLRDAAGFLLRFGTTR